jgi:signal transduction histidine kinase
VFFSRIKANKTLHLEIENAEKMLKPVKYRISFIFPLILFLIIWTPKLSFSNNPDPVIAFVDSVNQLDWEDQPISDTMLLTKSIAICDSLNYKKGLAQCYINFSNYYLLQSNGARTLFYALKCIEKSKTIEDYKMMIKGFIAVANVYTNENNLSQSIDNLLLALQYATLNDRSMLSVCYNALGYTYCLTGDYKKSEDYLFKALYIAKEFDDTKGIGKAYTNLSFLYRYKGEYLKAIDYGQVAESYFQKITYQRGVVVNLTGMGICYSKLGNMDKAVEYHQKVLETARKHGDIESVGNAYYGFYTVYKEFGRYKEALSWYERLEDLEDSVINTQNQARILELTRFYTDIKQESEIVILKKEKLIQQLEIQKTRFTSIIIVVFLLGVLIIGVMFFRFKQNKNKAYLRESVLKAELSERKRIARDLHDNIGSHLAYLVGGLEQISKEDKNDKLLRLENFGRDAISQLRETIWAIQSNNTDVLSFVDRVRLLVNRYHQCISIDIINHIAFDSTCKLSALQTLYLYRIVQESVNNTFKHANASHLSIEFSMDADSIFRILISDNGKGFDNQKSTVGNGLKNMEQRAAEISATFQITSSAGNGTITSISCRIS